MRTYLYSFRNPSYLVNMDQTALYQNFFPNRIVDKKKNFNISTRVGGSSSTRLTLCVSVATDGKNCLCSLFLRAILRRIFPVSCRPVCLIAYKTRHGGTNVLCSNAMIRLRSLTLLTMTVILDYYWIIARSTPRKVSWNV